MTERLERWFPLLLVLVLMLAAALRLPDLGRRPMHTDETINAYITGQILAGEGYTYDPRDRHGPALYLITAAHQRLAGVHSLAEMDEKTFRLAPVIISSLAVLLFAGLRRPFGAGPALAAALLWAVAPLPLYYGRYVIHETGFVAATVGLIAATWRAGTNQSKAWAAVAGLMAATMLAFKETAIINWAALGLGLLVAVGLRGLFFASSPSPRQSGERAGVRGSLLPLWLVAATSFLVVTLAFFTWGFTDWRGPVDLLRAFVRFSGRAGGEGHQKPFFYFAKLFVDGWAGWPFVLAALAGALATWRQGAVWRFTTVYAAAIFLLHSFIPYKTPWLALNLWLPLALLAGGLLTLPQRRWIMGGALLLAIVGLSARDDVRRVYRRPADDFNPYAYSHTTEDVHERFAPYVEGLAAKKPAGQRLKIAVVATDAWPFPWYLRRFEPVGYWQPGQDPGDADIYITDYAGAEKLETKLKGWRPEFFGVRANVLFILWQRDT